MRPFRSRFWRRSLPSGSIYFWSTTQSLQEFPFGTTHLHLPTAELFSQLCNAHCLKLLFRGRRSLYHPRCCKEAFFWPHHGKRNPYGCRPLCSKLQFGETYTRPPLAKQHPLVLSAAFSWKTLKFVFVCPMKNKRGEMYLLCDQPQWNVNINNNNIANTTDIHSIPIS